MQVLIVKKIKKVTNNLFLPIEYGFLLDY